MKRSVEGEGKCFCGVVMIMIVTGLLTFVERVFSMNHDLEKSSFDSVMNHVDWPRVCSWQY